LPLVRPTWWESHHRKAAVAVILSIPALAWLLASGETVTLVHSLRDYASFLALKWSGAVLLPIFGIVTLLFFR
jgi:hypothetical protein